MISYVIFVFEYGNSFWFVSCVLRVGRPYGATYKTRTESTVEARLESVLEVIYCSVYWTILARYSLHVNKIYCLPSPVNLQISLKISSSVKIYPVQSDDVIFEVLTAMRKAMMFFRLLAPCRLAGRCQCIGETYLILKMEAVCFYETLVFTDESVRRQNVE